jgi:hypothetical protein
MLQSGSKRRKKNTWCAGRDVLLLYGNLYETEICSGSLGLRHKQNVMLFHRQFEQIIGILIYWWKSENVEAFPAGS